MPKPPLSHRPLSLVLALGLCLSCGSPSGGATPDAGSAVDARGGSLDASPETGVGSTDSGGVDCTQGCSGTAPAGSMCVISADAKLVDETGAPVSGEALLLCGTNLCSLPVKTDATGGAHFNLCLNMSSPALKYLGGTRYVSFASAMTSPAETFPPVTLVPLPALGAPFPSDAGQVTSGDVTLALAAPIKFDPGLPNDPSSMEFRAATMDPAKAPPGLDPALGVKGLFGLAPVNATMSPPAAVTVPNPDPKGWVAGTAVDFIVNSLDEAPHPPVPYGTWGRVARGTVSADGKTITTDSDAGNGLPLTGIIGVAPHL